MCTNTMVSWNNMFESIEYCTGTSLSIGILIVLMISSCIIQVILIWYFDNLFNSCSLRMKFWYPLTLYYWCTKLKGNTTSDELNPLLQLTSGNYPISLINIGKELNKTKVLENVSLDIPKNKISCIVSPNGSGKSILFKIIIGIFGVDNGEVYIKGINSKNHLNLSKNGLSYCPQVETQNYSKIIATFVLGIYSV